MKRLPLPLWFAFPIFGSLLPLLFRTSETDLRSFAPAERLPIRRLDLPLSDGTLLRTLGLPGPDGGPLFFLGETEVSAAQFRLMDRAHRSAGFAAAVSEAEARAFCAWLSDTTGHTVRLPTLAERRLAAAGGLANAEVPWGFDPQRVPAGVSFGRNKAPSRPGPRFGYGFRDLAGGLWEWTAEGLVTGGAWSERDPRQLRLDTAHRLPDGYRGADAGFRILVEVPR